jgi:hypothetical protein
MRKHLAVAAATFALTTAGALATSANATTFAGNWTATYNSSDSQGLPITIGNDSNSPANGSFSRALNFIGDSSTFNLFTISTNQDELDSNDGNHRPITVTFNFTAPSSQQGQIGGDTYGQTVPVTMWSSYEQGVLTWDNGGDTTVNFGAAGTLLIHLNDVNFNRGGTDWNWEDPELGNSAGQVKATFTLKAGAPGAVPEPMTWAMMLVGFFGLGAMLRVNRRQALTVA